MKYNFNYETGAMTDYSLDNWASRDFGQAPYWCVQFNAEKNGYTIEGTQAIPLQFEFNNRLNSPRDIVVMLGEVITPLSIFAAGIYGNSVSSNGWVAVTSIPAGFGSMFLIHWLFSKNNEKSRKLQQFIEPYTNDNEKYEICKKFIETEEMPKKGGVEYKQEVVYPLTLPFIETKGFDNENKEKALITKISNILDPIHNFSGRFDGLPKKLNLIKQQEFQRLKENYFDKGFTLDFMGKKINNPSVLKEYM
jgi:hypothetical protein